MQLFAQAYFPYLENTEAMTPLCQYIAISVKPRALRHLDDQLKSALRGPSVGFSSMPPRPPAAPPFCIAGHRKASPTEGLIDRIG